MRFHSVAYGYGEPNATNNAIGSAKFFSRSHDAVIRIYDEAGNVIETHERTGDLKTSEMSFLLHRALVP
jgi:hypothetical protein